MRVKNVHTPGTGVPPVRSHERSRAVGGRGCPGCRPPGLPDTTGRRATVEIILSLMEAANKSGRQATGEKRNLKSNPVRQVLTINSGSSSLKFAVFRLTDRLAQVLTGKIERIGFPGARFLVHDVLDRKREESAISAPDHVACVPVMVEWLERKAS